MTRHKSNLAKVGAHRYPLVTAPTTRESVSKPVKLLPTMSEMEQRSIRRRSNELFASQPQPVLPARRETLRDVLEAFADGSDSLHGFPRHLVDWPALWAYCERNERA